MRRPAILLTQPKVKQHSSSHLLAIVLRSSIFPSRRVSGDTPSKSKSPGRRKWLKICANNVALLSAGLIFVVVTMINLSCTHRPTKSAVKESLREAQTLYDGGKFEEALALALRLRPKVGTSLDLETQLLKGKLYTQLNQCENAIETLRGLAAISRRRSAEMEARSLYTLSSAYECRGDQERSLAALLDSFQRATYLQPIEREAEIPSRLAAAYARAGQDQEAAKFAALAHGGLKKWGPLGNRSLLAKTLLAMGTNHQKEFTLTSFKQDLSSLRRLHEYLIDCIEINISPYSDSALEELNDTLSKLVAVVTSAPDSSQEKEQAAADGLEHIEFLKTQLPLIGKPTDLLTKTQKTIETANWELEKHLNKKETTPTLTEEAKKLQSLKREGRPVDP